MIRSIIVEDELHCQEKLSELLERLNGNISVLKRFQTVSEAQEYLESSEIDLVFLDVELKGGTAFELLRNLKEIDFDIIFTTAHNSFAQEAFEYSAVHYLLKPIAFDKLSKAIERVVNRQRYKNSIYGVKELLYNLEVHSSLDKKLVVPTVEGFDFIKTGEIVRVLADGNYCQILLKNGLRHTVSKSLKHYDQLLDKHFFYRVHQSHIVNLGFVDKYLKGQGGNLIMFNGDRVPVSVRKKEDFFKQLALNKQL